MPRVTKLGRVVTYLEERGHIKSYVPLILQSPKNMRSVKSHNPFMSRDNLKPLHLQCYSAYGHQTWPGCNLPSLAHSYNLTWGFDHVVLQGHTAIEKHIYTTRVSIAIKFGGTLTSLDSLQLINSHDFLITWSCNITRPNKTIISPIPQCLWPSNVAGWSLTFSNNLP